MNTLDNLFLLLLTPLTLFAFQPVRVFIVAFIMLLPCLSPRYRPAARLAMAVAAILWFLFGIFEAQIPTSSNIRVDLVLIGPIYLLAALGWFVAVVNGRRRSI